MEVPAQPEHGNPSDAGRSGLPGSSGHQHGRRAPSESKQGTDMDRPIDKLKSWSTADLKWMQDSRCEVCVYSRTIRVAYTPYESRESREKLRLPSSMEMVERTDPLQAR